MNIRTILSSKIAGNFYVLSSSIFLVWVTFFDGNDLISLFSNRYKLAGTESEIRYFQEKIQGVVMEQARLKGNKDAMERVARERFLMKKDDEDVFIFPDPVNTSMIDRWFGF